MRRAWKWLLWQVPGVDRLLADEFAAGYHDGYEAATRDAQEHIKHTARAKNLPLGA